MRRIQVFSDGSIQVQPLQDPAPVPQPAPLPGNLTKEIALGAVYERIVITSPRTVVTHTVTIERVRVKRYFVTPQPSKATKPSDYAAQYQPTVLINGDEHTYPGGGTIPQVKGNAISDFETYNFSTDEPSLNIRGDNSMEILYGMIPHRRNVISGSHLLLKQGALVSMLDNVSLDPRTMVGFDDRHFYMVVTEGRLPNNLGLSLLEAAAFMASRGAKEALNLDGGKDSLMWINGMGIVNQTPEGEQAIANCLAVWL